MNIKRKKKVCEECRKEKYIFSRGRCKSCASKEYRKNSKTSVKTRRKKNLGRGDFFKKHLILMPPFCQECQEPLEGSVSNVCHILPKSVFPEVELEDDNIMYYCFACHSRFDNFIMSRHKFKTFPVVLERFEKLKNKVKSKNNLYNYLQEHLDSNK